MTLPALNFPASPTVGQIYPDPPVTGQPTYIYDGGQWLAYRTAPLLPSYSAPFDAMGWSGMQINGSMDVSQEKGTGLTTAHDTHICDAWRLNNTSTGVVSASPFPSTTFIPGYTSVLTMVVTTSVPGGLTGSQTVDIETRIEGYRCARLAWGTASAQPVTIGFWSAHSKTGKYSVIFNSTGGTRTCATSYTQNASSTPEYKTITIPGDTTGSWNTSNGTGLAVHFVFAAGPTGATAAEGTWGTGYVSVTGQVNGVDSTANVLRITGVVVLPGIAAPTAAQSPLIMRPYDQELITCQRYYRQWGETPQAFQRFANGQCVSTTSAEVLLDFSPTMRSVPAYSMTGPTAVSAANGSLVAVTAISASIVTQYSLHLIATTGGGLVAGNATRLLVNNDANTRLKLDARL